MINSRENRIGTKLDKKSFDYLLTTAASRYAELSKSFRETVPAYSGFDSNELDRRTFTEENVEMILRETYNEINDNSDLEAIMKRSIDETIKKMDYKKIDVSLNDYVKYCGSSVKNFFSHLIYGMMPARLQAEKQKNDKTFNAMNATKTNFLVGGAIQWGLYAKLMHDVIQNYGVPTNPSLSETLQDPFFLGVTLGIALLVKGSLRFQTANEFGYKGIVGSMPFELIYSIIKPIKKKIVEKKFKRDNYEE